MPITIPTVAEGGSTPAPVDWANDHVKPAIESLDARRGGPTPKSGQYLYPRTGSQWSGGAVAYASGANLAVPLVVTREITVDKLACRVSTAQASCNVRILLYSSDDNGEPLTLVAHGVGSAGATGVVVVTFSSVTLPPGVYWGMIRTDTGSTVRFWALQSHQIAWDGVADAADQSKTPLPAIDVGTYASPTTTLTGVTHSGTGGTAATVPFICIGRA